MSPERRQEFAPVLARTFASLGYRRATTSELAKCCGVQENILYRLWPDKRAMFIAALDYVYQLSVETWLEILAKANPEDSAAELILEYEATHHGEFGLYRIVFAGLTETDDLEIKKSLRQFYRRTQTFIQEQLSSHRKGKKLPGETDPELSAWAFLGLGTIVSIGRELGLMPASTRKLLFQNIGRQLLEGAE
jgi:AcrR family transcriptional regulator